MLDAALFRPDSIDEETRRTNDFVEQMLARFPPVNERNPADIRAERELGRGPFPPPVRLPEASDVVIDGPAGALGLRIVRHEQPRAVYLHVHGGGWTLGAADQQDLLLKLVSDACEATVVSVDYRLAPENPYPAGPDDCEAAALWVADHARELGHESLLIGGESAGAHLAVVTLLRLRDRHQRTPFRAANLVFGAYDLGMTPSVRRWGMRNLILNTPIVQWFADNFVSHDRRADPDVSPLYADLRGLPPALFTIGTLDPLLDDSLFMHGRWLAAGNAAELAVYPGGIHAFTLFPTALAQRANLRQLEFLKQHR